MEKRICLNGFWDFSTDVSISAEGADRMPKTWEEHKICVPSPYNINAFSAGREKSIAGESFYVQGGDFCLYPNYPVSWNHAECGAYRRMFFVPEESRGKRIFLHFDAVAYHSVFYVNGEFVKEETEAFLPIEIEITKLVRFGKENEIIVMAEGSKRYMYKDEKGWNRIDYPKGSFWGEFVAGIWQDVWYVERPDIYISDVFVVTDIWKETLSAKFELDGLDRIKEEEEYQKEVFRGKNNYKIRFSLVDLENHKEMELGECDASQKVFEWNYSKTEIKLWEIEHPALYQLRAQLLVQHQVCDTKVVRFGFRSFIAKGEKFYLNKKPLNLKNDSWHYMGYSIQTPEYARSYYKMAKDAGVNIIRLHAQPFPSFFYDIADEMGMLLVSESAVWASHCNFSYNDAFFENSRRHLIRLVLRDRNHPSVVLWSPENECIPAYRYCGSNFIKDEQELESKLYEFLKVIYDYDTSRLISCDGSGDLGGRLPVNSLHYPGFDCPVKSGKPITIGEMGSMYYSTPDMVCMEKGQETLKSSNARLWAVGEDAYRNLMGERRWASQICVFNLIWYGLEPLPFKDRLLTYEDYTTPGIKPERITPYLRTLNAGGDESLPEYIPNPVWDLTKRAYIPVRSYIDRMPEQVYTGACSTLPLFLFYDEREDGDIVFSVTIEAEGQAAKRQEQSYKMKACESKETTVSILWPEKEGKVICKTAVMLCGAVVFEEDYSVEVFEEKRLIEAWEALQISCTSEENNSGNQSGIYYMKNKKQEQTYGLRKLFGANKEFTFREPLNCIKEEEQETKGNQAIGKALFFAGNGQPVIWYREEEGHQIITASLDLSHPTEAAQWLLLLELGNYLKQKKPETAKKIIFYGDADSPYVKILQTLGYEYKAVDEKQLLPMLSGKQDKILFADGSKNLGFLSNINSDNFKTAVIAGLAASLPEWYQEFEVTEKKTFHAYPTEKAVEQFGVYGTKLYGLTVGKECVIGEKLLEYRADSGERNIAWKVPDVDWRMWNNNPEQLKTVSLHRSEQTDNRRLSVLSLHHRGESDVWFNQLVPDVEHPKRKELWRNFLIGIGAGYGSSSKGKEAEQVIYEDGLCCLWTEEGGQIIRKGQKLPKGEKAGCVIYSPQDRTDFLYNPDMVHMEVHGEGKLKVYLNGELLGEGEDMRYTSICLAAGENRLILVSSEEQSFPKVTFERANKEELDLKFMAPQQ